MGQIDDFDDDDEADDDGEFDGLGLEIIGGEKVIRTQKELDEERQEGGKNDQRTEGNTKVDKQVL
jgi:hypothetical protein